MAPPPPACTGRSERAAASTTTPPSGSSARSRSGADPATLLAAVAPLPEGIDELAFAGFLRGSPTRLARARRLAMRVPADAEFVLEGLVPPGERRPEGPFGDHFGHYSHAAPFPVFHLREITCAERPIYQASVVGKPPQEDKFMGEAVQEMVGGALKVIHPEIRDLWAYFEAGFHNLLVVAVSNRFAKEAKKTALGLFGTGQLSLTKAIVLVDEDVNPRDRAAVFGALARNFDPAEDFILVPGVPLDTLDFTSFTMNLGSKMVLDAQSAPGAASARARDPRQPPRLGRHAGGAGRGRGARRDRAPRPAPRARCAQAHRGGERRCAARRRSAAAVGDLHALRLRARHRAGAH